MQALAGGGAASIAILAGGQAKRLGGAKHALELGGRPMIAHPVAAALATGLDSFVIAKPETELPELDCAVHREPDSPQHPLVGVLRALDIVGGGAVVVVGCDLPFVTAEALAWFAEQPEPLVVPKTGQQVHPLLARYTGSLATRLRASMEAGESMGAAVASLGPRYLQGDELAALGDPERLLFNVNTAADLAEARRMLEI